MLDVCCWLVVLHQHQRRHRSPSDLLLGLGIERPSRSVVDRLSSLCFSTVPVLKHKAGRVTKTLPPPRPPSVFSPTLLLLWQSVLPPLHLSSAWLLSRLAAKQLRCAICVMQELLRMQSCAQLSCKIISPLLLRKMILNDIICPVV